MSEPVKAMTLMTLRLPKQLADQLTLVAQIDQLSIVDVVRQASASYIAQRFADPVFRAQARHHFDDVNALIGETDV